MQPSTNFRGDGRPLRIVALTLSVAISIVAIALSFASTKISASDPSPVNPPGEIPDTVTDAEGNVYVVFTPERGGVVSYRENREDVRFEAYAGAVPSASLVAVRITKGGPASNLGATHHRYTFGGNYYIIDAVDINGNPLTKPFTFRTTPMICGSPIPRELFGHGLDAIKWIATDTDGATQTVLTNAGIGFDAIGLTMLCSYVGTVPTTLAFGVAGAPPPLSTPTVVADIEPEPTKTKLPPTGGQAPNSIVATIVLLIGLGFIGATITRWRFV